MPFRRANAWRIPPPRRRSAASRSADSERIARVGGLWLGEVKRVSRRVPSQRTLKDHTFPLESRASRSRSPKRVLLGLAGAERAKIGDEPLKVCPLNLIPKGGHGRSTDSNHLSDLFVAATLLPLGAAKIRHRGWRFGPVSGPLSSVAARTRHAIERGDGTGAGQLRRLLLSSWRSIRGDLVVARGRMRVVAGAPRTGGCFRTASAKHQREKPKSSYRLPVHAPILAADDDGINPKS